MEEFDFKTAFYHPDIILCKLSRVEIIIILIATTVFCHLFGIFLELYVDVTFGEMMPEVIICHLNPDAPYIQNFVPVLKMPSGTIK